MTVENFTSYTEVDPGTQLSTSTTRVTYTALSRAADAYISYDFGVAYFSDRAYLEGTYLISAGTGASPKSSGIGFTDTLNDAANTTNQCGAFHWLDGTNSALDEYVYLRESSVGASTALALTAVLSLSTSYTYRTGFLSSLGQYGGAFTQVFSDTGLTTLVAGLAKARTAAATYRYVIAGQNYTTGGAMTITGYDENVTVYQPAAGIDLTTGVETDTGTGRLAVYADCIVATALNVANSEAAKHVAIDEGADFFGDYTVSGVLNITAFASGTTAVPMFAILAVTDAAADARASNDLQGINIYWLTSTTYAPYIHQSVGGTDTVSGIGPTCNINQPYSFTLNRSGTTLTMKVWNDLVLTDFAGTSQVGGAGGTVTWTGRATTTYRYLMPVASTLNGATSRSSTFTLGGVQRLGNPPTNVTATKGAFSWAGTTATIAEQATTINATTGAFGWAGNASALSQMIQATKGAFNWAGKTVNLVTGGQVNTTPGAFSWAGKSSPLSRIITATTGAFSWAGKTSLLGSSVTSLRTATLTKWDTATSKEIPDTGLTGVLYMLYDPINLKVYDFSDNTFKASASCVTPQGTMTERVLLNSVGTNLTPGVYDILLSTTGLSGLYQEYLFYYGTTNHLDSSPVRFQDGIEYLGGLTVAENSTLNVIPTAAENATAVLAAATATPIAANMEQTNGIDLKGDGTAGDKFRSTLIA